MSFAKPESYISIRQTAATTSSSRSDTLSAASVSRPRRGAPPPDAYAELLERGGCKVKSIVYLPHYHGLLGKLDQIMMRVPLIRRFFQSRLLIVAVRS